MNMEVVIIAVILMALAFAMLGLNILVKKGGKFPNMHIGSNKGLKKQGVACATTQDRMAQKEAYSFKSLDLSASADQHK